MERGSLHMTVCADDKVNLLITKRLLSWLIFQKRHLPNSLQYLVVVVPKGSFTFGGFGQ
jgi:hypothetical protein